MKQAYEGIIYDTDKAILLARNDIKFDMELSATKIELYRTKQSRYFSFTHSDPSFLSPSRDDDSITTLSVDEAIAVYNKLTIRELDFNEAFPDLQFTEA